jgi:hypothetical protein
MVVGTCEGYQGSNQQRLLSVSLDIDYSLTSSEQYFGHILDENKLNDILKLYRNKRKDGSIGSTTFDCH